MNFFQHQDMARRNTRRLVILLGLATLALIAITTVAFAVVVLGLNTEGYVSYAEQGLWPTLKSVLSWQPLSLIALYVLCSVPRGGLPKAPKLRFRGMCADRAAGGMCVNLGSGTCRDRRRHN